MRRLPKPTRSGANPQARSRRQPGAMASPRGMPAFKGPRISGTSFLTFRAPEGRTPILVEAAHDAAAAFGVARFAFAVVDLKRMLKIAELSRGLAVVAQRRAAGLDRLIEHGVDRFHQPPRVVGRFAFFGRQRCRQSSRRQARAKQRLTDIDVAEARDDALVEQGGLEAGLLVGA